MLNAPNIVTHSWNGTFRVEQSPLPYNDRRRFGARLKRLYQHLKSLPKDRYDHRVLVKSFDAEPKTPKCGSVACAFGHAVVSGKFKGLGMTVRPKARAKLIDGKYREDDLVYKVLGPQVRAAIKELGVFRDRGGAVGAKEAADVYFGPGSWRAIFEYDALGHFEPTKAEVMARIAVIAKGAYGVDVKK